MKGEIRLLVLVLFLVSAASAGTLICGSLDSDSNGNPTFTTATNGAGGTANAAAGTIACNPFTVPVNMTLISISFEVTDNADESIDTNSQISWTWVYTGTQGLAPVPGSFNTEQGNALGSFNPCVGGGNLGCNALVDFNPTGVQLDGGMQTGTLSFDVTPIITGPLGDGLGETGADSAQLSVLFTYAPTSSIPEPPSLLLIGGGLICLGLLTRRKSKVAAPRRRSTPTSRRLSREPR